MVLRLLSEDGEEIPIVLTSSIVDLTEPVETPVEVLDDPWVTVFPLPETVKMGLIPDIGFPNESLIVRVIPARSVLLALIGPLDTSKVDLVASGAPAMNVAELLGKDAILGEARLTVRVSATVDTNLLTKVPELLVVPLEGVSEDWAMDPEELPSAVKLTFCPETGFPLASLSVKVKVA